MRARLIGAVVVALAAPPAAGALTATQAAAASAIYVNTVAGNGTKGLCGDGGTATAACLYNARTVDLDPSGNLYVADSGNGRVRKVSVSGTITTLASGMNSPQGLAVTSTGYVYVADTEANRVRRVSPGGSTAIVAGNGTAGFCGDGGAATSACLKNPRGVAVDTAGNVIIADAGNNRIRKVTPGGTITTIAGNGSSAWCGGDGGPATASCLNAPRGVAVDGYGQVYIADQDHNRVRKVDTGGNIWTIAGNGSDTYCGDGGAATSACLRGPRGVDVDSSLNVYIADTGNNVIRKVTAGGIISTVAGSGSSSFCGDTGVATSACLRSPGGVAVASGGDLFIADTSNQRIRKTGKDVMAATSLRVSVSPSNGFTKSRSIPVSWSASDPSGIAYYDVAWFGYRWNGTAYSMRTWLNHTWRRSYTYTGSTGITYCFRQRARDGADNISGWSATGCTSVPLRADQVRYGKGWKRLNRSYYYSKVGASSNRKGARAALYDVVGERIVLIVTKCRTCGSIRVYWNGSLVKTVNLYSRTTKHMQYVTIKSWSTPHRGDLVIKVASSGKIVVLEGVGIFRN